MPIRTTEARHPEGKGLDARDPEDILSVLLVGQQTALAVVGLALPAIAAGAAMMADVVRGKGQLVYAGAGSSALMAVADGLELAGTFGIDPARIRLCMAGGVPQTAEMPGDTEDDVDEGARVGMSLGPHDLVIAVTASGSTPYPLALAREARARGAKVIALANNRDAPLFAVADVAICLPTPPEVLSGSTRLGAATAQKAALNMMSTLMGVHLGAVHDGLMVSLKADNIKLRARAVAMVAEIAGLDAAAADRALSRAGGEVKPAVMVGLGLDRDQARSLLDQEQGILRAALARMNKAQKGQSEKINQGSVE